MKIEILLTELSNKAAVLTHLAKKPEIRAGGNELEVEGLKLEVGEEYLLFTITRWERAEEVVPLLFSVKTAHTVHTFRPESGLKALVTCRARSIPEIIPELTSVEHLDLEAGELAGEFQVHWRAHDVAVSAEAKLMVQGGLGVAKIRFITHSMDTEYHCRACISMVSFREILAVFCREPLQAPVNPVVSPVVLEGRAVVEGDGWSTFINERAGFSTKYDRSAGELKLDLGSGSYIHFREGKARTKEVHVHLLSAGVLTDNLAADAAGLLGLKEIKVHREIDGVVLDLDRLRRELGFRLGAGLTDFVRDGIFTARYDTGRLALTMEAMVSLEGLPVQERLARICSEMETFTGQVMACAV